MAYHADKAYLIGFIIEAMLYGIYIVLFGFSLAFLVWRRRTAGIHWFMLISTCILFIASTTHFGFGFNNVISAFINRRNEVGEPAVIVEEPDFDLLVDIMFSVNNFLGDAILIWRCWLVWQRGYRIVAFPAFILVVYAASAIVGLHNLSQVSSGGNQFSAPVAIFGTASFALSLALNFIVTFLIAGRIYYLANQLRGVLPERRTRQYMNIVIITMESGAIFTFVQVVFVVLWGIHSNAHWIGANPASQIYCIVPTLIIVRVGLGVSTEQTMQKTRPYSTIQFGTRPNTTDTLNIAMERQHRPTGTISEGSTYYSAGLGLGPNNSSMIFNKNEDMTFAKSDWVA
ncbi:hypothetical protein NEOLEDRAFT_893217 [Neolentinus lepideus HHB14362 ss-1]|uniref:Uncharacterized protein n=1 Tax=Neolentinus lepideus HHB14362 ss-1 TaxID=1314782 RepID=A0A165NU88_9AGAM|nr:hypothetical protein NEOLEDRAFT_893217 [Neolentinus lepideus HHB14362 ss-1]